MAPLTSSASAPGPIRPIEARSTFHSAQAYGGGVRPQGSAAASSAGSAAPQLAPEPRLSGPSPLPTKPARSAWTPAPASPFLSMVISDLQSTLRMAEAFRQAAALAEPPVVYRQLASRVYTLEIQAQQEINRLRGEGISIARQWFA